MFRHCPMSKKAFVSQSAVCTVPTSDIDNYYTTVGLGIYFWETKPELYLKNKP